MLEEERGRDHAAPSFGQRGTKRASDLLRFSWLHLSDICVGAATPAVVAYTVNAVFGTATLGQLNIALRLVEPARQLVGGIGHNIVFSMLYRMQDAPARLVLAAAETVASVGVLAIPAFLGLAVCVPALLPLLVGPGWEGHNRWRGHFASRRRSPCRSAFSIRDIPRWGGPSTGSSAAAFISP